MEIGPDPLICFFSYSLIRNWISYNVVPLQYSCLENPIDGGAWKAAVNGVAKSQIWLSDFTFTFHFHALEKEMATHSSVLAWWIPGMGEPGGLLSMGSHRVEHNWSDLAAAAAFSVGSPSGPSMCQPSLGAEAPGRGSRADQSQEMIGVLWFGVMDPWSCQ